MAAEKGNVAKLVLAFVTLILGIALLGQVAVSTNDITSDIQKTDTFTLVRDGPGGLYNASNDINATASVFSLAYVNDAWRQDISECSLATTIDSNRINAYNKSGALLTMNGCTSGGDYYLVDTINSITFCNQSLSTNGTGSTTASVTYTTCPTDYVSGWAQTVLLVAPGLFGIALLIVSVGLFYTLYRDNVAQ